RGYSEKPRCYTASLAFFEVPHVGQLCSWDCGLACIVMVLRTIGIDQCNIQALTEFCSTT
ncbi:hypothetical protein MKX01_003074, partial [Papaver californicum]